MSLSSSSTLEVSALSLSLSPDESHYLLISFYRDSEGTIPMLQLYIEAFLCNDFCINHFEILDTTPLILEAELFLYFTCKGGLAERFPPRLINWKACLREILDASHDLLTLLETESA